DAGVEALQRPRRLGDVLLRPQLRPSDDGRGQRRRDVRLRRPVPGRPRAGEPVRHPVPPGEEPGQRPRDPAELRGRVLKIRLIPVLLLQNGLLVRSERFELHQIIGNPVYEVQRFNEWNVDELVYLDITRDDTYDLRRDDHKTRDLGGPLGILDAVSATCFMPLTWGGRVRSLDDMRERFRR